MKTDYTLTVIHSHREYHKGPLSVYEIVQKYEVVIGYSVSNGNTYISSASRSGERLQLSEDQLYGLFGEAVHEDYWQRLQVSVPGQAQRTKNF